MSHPLRFAADLIEGKKRRFGGRPWFRGYGYRNDDDDDDLDIDGGGEGVGGALSEDQEDHQEMNRIQNDHWGSYFSGTTFSYGWLAPDETIHRNPDPHKYVHSELVSRFLPSHVHNGSMSGRVSAAMGAGYIPLSNFWQHDASHQQLRRYGPVHMDMLLSDMRRNPAVARLIHLKDKNNHRVRVYHSTGGQQGHTDYHVHDFVQRFATPEQHNEFAALMAQHEHTPYRRVQESLIESAEPPGPPKRVERPSLGHPGEFPWHDEGGDEELWDRDPHHPMGSDTAWSHDDLGDAVMHHPQMGEYALTKDGTSNPEVWRALRRSHPPSSLLWDHLGSASTREGARRFVLDHYNDSLDLGSHPEKSHTTVYGTYTMQPGDGEDGNPDNDDFWDQVRVDFHPHHGFEDDFPHQWHIEPSVHQARDWAGRLHNQHIRTHSRSDVGLDAYLQGQASGPATRFSGISRENLSWAREASDWWNTRARHVRSRMNRYAQSHPHLIHHFHAFADAADRAATALGMLHDHTEEYGSDPSPHLDGILHYARESSQQANRAYQLVRGAIPRYPSTE